MSGSSFSSRLDRLFEEQAARTPESVALIDDRGTMTFAELRAVSNGVAALLREQCACEHARIGLHMERSRHHVAALLGILKAGCAVVPLPPSYPPDRLREIVSSAALDAVLVDQDLPVDSSFHDRILHVSDAIAVRHAHTTGIVASDPNDPAFVLCSSGSTGKPKLIVRSHRSFFHRLRWTWETHPYKPGEVCCQKAYMTTTHSVYELFEPLLRGVPVCIISDQQTRSLETFWDTVRRQGISRLLLVPSMLQASLDMPGFAPPSTIQVLVLMGEHVNARLAARTRAAFPDVTRVYSIYGSTEASSTLVCDLRAWTGHQAEPPLGKPISPDIRTHVLDQALEPAASGAEGMLYIGGPPLFTEYLGDPALTAAAFATTHTGERLYRTNDRVRRQRDGSLQFLGRADHVVKIRGFRVDLQEVEGTIAAHPAVNQCAVVAEASGGNDAMLVAFVSPESVSAEAVFRLVGEHLPDYMIPSRVIALPALPLTASRKVDRRLLRDMCTASVAPVPMSFRTATESRIAEVWQAVLAHGDFGPDSNFFEVGGTSLKTFSLISQLRRAFALERRQLSDDCIYRFPTVRDLALHLDNVRAEGGPRVDAGGPVRVTLKSGRVADAAPVFVIASAGGTLGSYEKLVSALSTKREVIGVRDPFLWGARDPTAGFQAWAALYFDAIRERQPKGPYYIVAYSSAGAFGYEIARQLRRAGEEIAVLALIDPLAIDRSSKRRFGYWAFETRFMRRELETLVRAGAWLHRVLPHRQDESSGPGGANDFVFTPEQFRELEIEAKTSHDHILQLSALLEFNTGMPLALAPSQMASLKPDQYLPALLARIRGAAPEVETETIERLAVQYLLQVRSQHRYRLMHFDGTLVLFGPDDRYLGLLTSQFRPHVNRLVVHRVKLGAPDDRAQRLSGHFFSRLRSHYLSMRDDTFVQTVARELDKLL